MNKDTVVTFEELYRLLVERDRFIKQKEENANKLQQLTIEIGKVKTQLEKVADSISSCESKIRAVCLGLAEHDPQVSRDLLRGKY